MDVAVVDFVLADSVADIVPVDFAVDSLPAVGFAADIVLVAYWDFGAGN